jgi:erythrin-vacuolar iron transport family protein
MRTFDSLTEKEILALAIALEEEDARIYDDFAEGVAKDYPATAEMFRVMRKQEDGHRHRLIDTYRARFGEHIPLIRRQDVKGFVQRRPMWLMHPLRLEAIRSEAASMEAEVARSYLKAAQRATDAGVRQLLGDLAEEERVHEHTAERLEHEKITPDVQQEEEDARRRLFVLQIVQPGLAGLMDGSVSTLAPLFAAAFATRDPHDAFKVGMAAAVGAGISMGFAEALSDDGSLTGRGHPWVRGIVCGLMTTLGGVGHALPYLIPHFKTATAVAIIVVLIELAAISYIRNRYMDTPFLAATFQVVVGGVLVLIAGIALGVA